MGITLDELVMGEKEEDALLFKKEVANQRTKNYRRYLISAICFSFAVVCWVISCVLNIVNGNDVAAVVNALNVVILSITIGLSLRRYFEIKGQGSSTD